MPDQVLIARVRRARGIRGEVVVESFSSIPDRFQPGLRLFASSGGPLVVERSWTQGAETVLKFAGVDDRNAAEELRGLDLWIPEEERPPLGEGEVYLGDLVGCTMQAPDGRVIGEVAGWQDFGAAPILEVRAGAREILVPFVPAICVRVDLEGKSIIADLPEGLEDLNG